MIKLGKNSTENIKHAFYMSSHDFASTAYLINQKRICLHSYKTRETTANLISQCVGFLFI